MTEPSTKPTGKPPAPAAAAPDKELDQVREIILGPDTVRQRLRKPEVDRLREIIFGAQMEEYERRFADLHREMERLVGDLRQVQDGVSEFEQAQTKRLESLEREMRRATDELRREVDRLRAQEPLLQQILTQARQQEMMSQTLSDQIGELRKIVTQQGSDLTALRNTVGEHRDQRERKLDALKRELRGAEDSLRAELRRVADRLDDQKTDRKALAAMLMEIATRLETGSSMTGLLGGLTSPEG